MLGGLGLRSAERVRVPAYWASWADCLQMIRERHPSVPVECVHQLEGQPTDPAHVAAVECARAVAGAAGFSPPSWRALATRARPPLRDVMDFEPGRQKRGWQHEAARRVDQQFQDEDLFHRVLAPVRALIRSLGGPMAGHGSLHQRRTRHGCNRTCSARSCSADFANLCPFPSSTAGVRPLDSSGHHRAACAQAAMMNGLVPMEVGEVHLEEYYDEWEVEVQVVWPTTPSATGAVGGGTSPATAPRSPKVLGRALTTNAERHRITRARAKATSTKEKGSASTARPSP